LFLRQALVNPKKTKSATKNDFINGLKK